MDVKEIGINSALQPWHLLKQFADPCKVSKKNGMLRHSLATLEGSNLLWHIVAPSSLLSLFLPVWTK